MPISKSKVSKKVARTPKNGGLSPNHALEETLAKLTRKIAKLDNSVNRINDDSVEQLSSIKAATDGIAQETQRLAAAFEVMGYNYEVLLRNYDMLMDRVPESELSPRGRSQTRDGVGTLVERGGARPIDANAASMFRRRT